MIQLTSDFAVAADGNQYIVGKPVERCDDSGNVTASIRRPRYFSTLASAIKYVISVTLQEQVADNSISTLSDFIEEQQRLQDDFAERLIALE